MPSWLPSVSMALLLAVVVVILARSRGRRTSQGESLIVGSPLLAYIALVVFFDVGSATRWIGLAAAGLAMLAIARWRGVSLW